jgi:hypothetical protein
MDRFIGLKQLGNRGAWALIAVMAIVAGLGYQQYRWIVRIAAAEAKGNHEKLEAALKKFADDFDTEITRAHLTFAGLAGASTPDVLEKATERLQEFRRLSPYPGLIAAMDVTEGLPDPFTVDPGPPPALVVPVAVTQAASESAPGQYLAVQPFVKRGPQLRVRTGAGIGFRGALVRLRIVLDQDYLTGVLLPRLLDRHLGSGFQNHYDLVLHRRDRQGRAPERKSDQPAVGRIAPNIFHPARLPDRPGRSRRPNPKQPSYGESGISP